MRDGEVCPHCKHSGEFDVHDCRSRTFRVIVAGWVKVVRSGIWRWLSGLGDGLQGTFRKAWRLIYQQEPRSTLHRQDWSVSPAKYRSDQRRQTLQRALQALVVRKIFQDLFGKAIFPNFATAATWR